MSGRIPAAFAIAGAVAVVTLGLTSTAYGHTPAYSVACVANETELSVSLAEYSGKGTNTVTITDNGAEVVKKDFAKVYDFQRKFDGAIARTFVMKVAGWDNSDGSEGWSFGKELKVAPCVKITTTVTTTPPSSSRTVPPGSNMTSTASVEVPSPLGGETSPPLAATGASPIWLVLTGIGLVGAGAAALLLVRTGEPWTRGLPIAGSTSAVGRS
jgi:hypothetical protein